MNVENDNKKIIVCGKTDLVEVYAKKDLNENFIIDIDQNND